MGKALQALEKTLRILAVSDTEKAIISVVRNNNNKLTSQAGVNQDFKMTIEYLNQLPITGQTEVGIEILKDFALEQFSKVNLGEKVPPLLDLRTNALGYYFAAILLYDNFDNTNNLDNLLEIVDQINKRHEREGNSYRKIVVNQAYYEDINRKFVVKDTSNKILKDLVMSSDSTAHKTPSIGNL